MTVTATRARRTTPATEAAAVLERVPVSPRKPAALPTREAMQAAMESITNGDGAITAATTTLADITRERYAFHALPFTVNGTLPSSLRSDVAALLWQDAGYPSAPPATGRTKGERSLGQYIARYGTVSADMAHGVGKLADTKTARAAYDAIGVARKAGKQGDNAIRGAASHAGYEAWRKSLPVADQRALDKALSLFANTSVGATHRAAFIALLTNGAK